MDHLSSCYFCGIALDRPLQTYRVSGSTSDDDDDLAVTLCPTCHQKLDMILDATAAAATAPVSGDEPATGTIEAAEPDTVLVDLDVDDETTVVETQTADGSDSDSDESDSDFDSDVDSDSDSDFSDPVDADADATDESGAGTTDESEIHPSTAASPETRDEPNTETQTDDREELETSFESRFSETLDTTVEHPDETAEKSGDGVEATESDTDEETDVRTFNIGKKLGTDSAEFDTDGEEDTETGTSTDEPKGPDEEAHEAAHVDQQPERKAAQSDSPTDEDTIQSGSPTDDDAVESSAAGQASNETSQIEDSRQDEVEPAQNSRQDDGTQSSGDAQPTDGTPRANITALEYNKVMRLLQNREFPVDRNEIQHIAASAYDLPETDCAAVIDLAVDRGLLEEDGGKLFRPE